MITTITNDLCFKFVGKSSDAKPTEQVSNGSSFFELDTKKIFMFDKDTTTWVEITSANVVFSI